MRRYGVSAPRLDDRVDNWERTNFDIFSHNAAAAYRMLRCLDVGPYLDGRHDGPSLEFHNGGYLDNFPCCFVTVSDPFALSLLQARLIELNAPICVRLMNAAITTADCHKQVDEFVRTKTATRALRTRFTGTGQMAWTNRNCSSIASLRS
jgi:hypothetical protein